MSHRAFRPRNKTDPTIPFQRRFTETSVCRCQVQSTSLRHSSISIYVNPCLRLRLASSIVHLARFIHQALPQRKAPNPKPTILSSAVKARTPGYLSK
ncbi:AB hydrolase superfamily protein YdjP [Fusarium oxysporum f. sp. albedinis]|nr:AB hydrolase superfamily protein YdjP [Fusarium oxysporum f. sp. albedinis]